MFEPGWGGGERKIQKFVILLDMKYFLIKYHLKEGLEEQWHQKVIQFISELENDSDLQGKISYRCMKGRGSSEYYHLASATDDQAAQALQSKGFFSRYTEQTKSVAEGEVVVLLLE